MKIKETIIKGEWIQNNGRIMGGEGEGEGVKKKWKKEEKKIKREVK